MTVGREWKLIFMFALPIMAGNLLQQLYNTVDGIVVGNYVGEAAFSAVGTCAAITFLFLAFAMGLSVGAGVVVAQYFGAKREKDVAVSVDTSLILLAAVGAVITVIGYAVTPFLLKNLLNVPGDLNDPNSIIGMAVTYLRIYCIGLTFQFVYNCIASVLRAVGDSKASLYFLLASTIANTLLDVWFVASFRWGVAGAAWATVISQVLCVVFAYIYLRRRFPLQRGLRHFDGAICKTMLKIGVPTAVQQSIVSVGNVFMQRLVNGFGETCIAAFSAGTRINNFVFVPIIGFQSALANFAGQNVGARRFDRVKRGYRTSLIMSLSITIAICVALFAFAPYVVTIFGLTAESVAMGTEQIRFLAPTYWIFAAYMTLGGVLQGAGDTILQSIATLTALALRVVLGYVGVNLGLMGYAAAWSTLPIGWAAAIIITNIRYYTGGWKKKAIAGRTTTIEIAEG
jgi:putative MATE family efflux protein